MEVSDRRFGLAGCGRVMEGMVVGGFEGPETPTSQILSTLFFDTKTWYL